MKVRQKDMNTAEILKGEILVGLACFILDRWEFIPAPIFGIVTDEDSELIKQYVNRKNENMWN